LLQIYHSVSVRNRFDFICAVFSAIITERKNRGSVDETTRAAVVAQGAHSMSVMEFQVCQRGRGARWVVTLGNAVYGAYLDKEQALLDAVDAARDALEAGREAQVWVRDSTTTARVF
jgi:hypothetical protein